MTDSAPLTDALCDYEAAIHALTPSAPDLHRAILTALAQRDAIQAMLNKMAFVPADHLIRLDALDEKLKSCKSLIGETIDQGKWRSLLHIPSSSWWWHFDPPALVPCLEKHHPWLERFDWLWKLLSVFALTFAFTVVLDTLNRVVGEGLNTQGMFPVVLQVVLTILGGTAALTEQGQKVLESVMARLRIPKHYWQEFSLVMSVVVVVIVVAIHEYHLPTVARNRYVQGIDAHAAGQFDSARQLLQQAIALQPDFVSAHYDLGVLYEDLQDIDAAVSEYQLVVQSDFQELPLLTQLRAHNNLGRLYIIRGEYRSAWIPLERGLGLIEATDLDDPAVLYENYNLLKNLGWVRVEEGHFIDAELYLQEALDLATAVEEAISDGTATPNGTDALTADSLDLLTRPAAASCLYGQVLEGLEREDEAQPFWTDCLRYGRRSNVDEAAWMAIARDRLTQDDTGADSGNGDVLE